MKLTREEIEHLGKLARIALTDEEKERYATELSAILDYVEQLQEVDTTDVEPTSQVTGLEDVYREDVVAPQSEEVVKKIIEQFPEREGDLLKVPGVFE
ncbi:MAG: Asp-tRNA(Asn)/Glu-tRNA(Gln) amidotransferase subunit GatC [Patescibacteria group bacterium]